MKTCWIVSTSCLQNKQQSEDITLILFKVIITGRMLWSNLNCNKCYRVSLVVLKNTLRASLTHISAHYWTNSDSHLDIVGLTFQEFNCLYTSLVHIYFTTAKIYNILEYLKWYTNCMKFWSKKYWEILIRG